MKNSNAFLCKLVVFLGLAALLAYLIKSFLVALAAGLVFGMALMPLLEKWRSRYAWVGRRFKATVLTLGFFCAFLVPMGLTLYFGATTVIKQIKLSKSDKIGSALMSNDGRSEAIDKWVQTNPKVKAFLGKLPVSEDSVLQMSDQLSAFIIGKAGELGQDFVSSLPSIFIGVLVALATMFFILADGHKARPFVERNPVFSAEATRQITSTFRESSYSVVVSAVIARVAQALVLVVACLITGKGSPLLIGLITFFCSFLPLFGSFIVAGVMMVAQLFAGDIGAATVFLIFGLIAGGVDNLVMSWLVGDQVKVPALLVFVAAFGGVETIGLSGLFVGPVVVATFLKVIEVLSHPSAAIVSSSLASSHIGMPVTGPVNGKEKSPSKSLLITN